MEKKHCKIHLQSRQKMGPDDETTSQEYIGEMVEREEKRYLSYQRNSEDGDISCLISFDRRSLSLTQKGALNSKLQLFPGKQTENIYSTPMGDLNLPIFTRNYQVLELGNKIKLVLDYDIITGGEPIRTSMDIEIEF
ncbi:DUF1934 domain-containing protein [Pseudobutyrivibrio xylanivorans]|uniref:Uncharacterized beta-barrel protein YwiB, DUF1934 family n=1 Tax=Pseudobutyrivibrio xylanivorans DSM 14809 TaxID=1123012 RepID=A0A1M6IDS8_PSEXY|nr:DUF1934 domain-containing protein [Pseudobutyrivibrio xylanivorans]SHJ32590.1 Uncharacterized beta-barrel protein YwiB, DUF1934 family [Pseudobutyrivibrio xylanivorans DSM 14809]